MSEQRNKGVVDESYIGKTVLVDHPRYEGKGILSSIERPAPAIAWVRLDHGHDRWYELEAVHPVDAPALATPPAPSVSEAELPELPPLDMTAADHDLPAYARQFIYAHDIYRRMVEEDVDSAVMMGVRFLAYDVWREALRVGTPPAPAGDLPELEDYRAEDGDAVEVSVIHAIRTWDCPTSLDWKIKATHELQQAHRALDQANKQVACRDRQLRACLAKLRAAESERDQARKSIETMTHWLSLGGPPMVLEGRDVMCEADPKDAHLIYGTAITSRKSGKLICEVHAMHEAESENAALKAQVERLMSTVKTYRESHREDFDCKGENTCLLCVEAEARIATLEATHAR